MSAEVDHTLPHRAGRLGVGPYSPVMKKIEKLEITMRNGRYTKLRSGSDVNELGYRFADVVRIDHYPEAWAVNGEFALHRSDHPNYVAKRIVFLTNSVARLNANYESYNLVIAGTVFILRIDQFSFGRGGAIVLNPIVLGSRKDISILFDASGETKRVGFKLLEPK